VFTLSIHADAEADLDELWKVSEKAAARILALLQEIQGDQQLLDALTVHDFGADHKSEFHVSKWLALWNRGLDLWRLKIWDLDAMRLAYRVVYAYEIGKQRYHVLGVFHRSFNYDRTQPRVQRLENVYHHICG
jgi:phage-related protein